MIQSMTGFGAAEHVGDGVSYSAEVRGVNHRYLKLTLKLPEFLQFTEPAIEKLLRGRVTRGSVSCAVRVQGTGESGSGPVDVPVLQQYVDQLSQVRAPAGVPLTLDLAVLAALPGVLKSPDFDDDARKRQVDIVTALVGRALDAMLAMRREEGRVLGEALEGCCTVIRGRLEDVRRRAPAVIDEYHQRLKTRVAALMSAGGFELQQDGLMREVAVYAERCDIAEELTRLGSHLDQFLALSARPEPVGRTLEFLTQELLREANTIASKSNDGGIARSVVDIKATIDRMKEQVQNVE